MLLIYHREGSYVQGGTPLALVGDFDRLLFSVTLEDQNTRHLFVGETMTLYFQAQSMKKAYDTEYAAGNLGRSEKIVATLREITPPLSESAGMRRVVCEIDNRARVLEPLTYNGVSMQAEHDYECLAVPLSAMTDASRSEVFVVDEGGKIRRQDVVIGANDGKYIEILSGLAEGDTVVTESFEGLDDDIRVEVSIEEDMKEKKQKGGER